MDGRKGRTEKWGIGQVWKTLRPSPIFRVKIDYLDSGIVLGDLIVGVDIIVYIAGNRDCSEV